jgi:isoquinoline 1-oxidoreductase subunit beta
MRKTSGTPLNPSRRSFIVRSAAAGGGLALGLRIPFDEARAQSTSAAASGSEVNAWVVINPDDTCVIRVARSEMGQGTHTGLAQLVVEELECDWSKIRIDPITAGQNLARKRVWKDMATGGSRGIRGSQEYLRRGGAAARMMLLQAAADEWQVPVRELTVSNGVITHAGSNRTTTYGKVAARSAKLTPPDEKSIALKDPKTWKVAGKPMKRVDTMPMVDGSKVFAIDVKLPGMLNAAIMACPVFGAKLANYDDSKAKSMPGVKGVVKVHDNAVAVVADTWWHAKRALDAVNIKWEETPTATITSNAILDHLKAGLKEGAYAERQEGDAIAAIDSAAKKVEAIYFTPFLHHSTMEPMNCTARIGADKGEVWVATQNAEGSLAALSEESGLPLAKCEVYRHDLGGGFGRRGGPQDYVRQAVAIAKQFPDTPVKMIWSREEDQAHGYYRPVSMCRMVAGLDKDGNLLGMHWRVSGQSINAHMNPAAIKDGKDKRQTQGMWAEPGDAQLGYTFPAFLLEYAMRNTHVPVGPWRGVNTNQNGVYSECFMDEVAKAAGKDPLEFRRQFMSKHPKHLGILNAVAEKAEWGKPLPDGVYRGIAQFMGYGSYSAAVAEVSVSPKGELKVHRIVIGVNSGHAVNPQQIEAQAQGSVAMGLTAALYGEMTLDKGRMQELNFHNYQILRLAEMPKVEVLVAPTGDFWGGVGEPTICVVSPAVMNAIYAATGKPVRSLPIKNQKLV